jgi:LemA protein
MKKLWIVLGVVALLVVILISTVVGTYNRFVTLNESIKASWAQVENQLQRRNDLIPNLVNTVKGYAAHEKGIFEDVANARAALGGAKSINEKIKANHEMEGALSRLLAIAENYPNLKANENFIHLQDELAGTENRIAVERMRYNEVVQVYNIMIKQFPGNIIASIFRFEKQDVYFKAEEAAKTVPKVQF